MLFNKTNKKTDLKISYLASIDINFILNAKEFLLLCTVKTLYNKKCLWNIYAPPWQPIQYTTLDWIKQNFEVSNKTKICSIHHDLELWWTCLDIMTNAVNRPTNQMTFSVTVAPMNVMGMSILKLLLIKGFELQGYCDLDID